MALTICSNAVPILLSFRVTLTFTEVALLPEAGEGSTKLNVVGARVSTKNVLIEVPFTLFAESFAYTFTIKLPCDTLIVVFTPHVKVIFAVRFPDVPLKRVYQHVFKPTLSDTV